MSETAKTEPMAYIATTEAGNVRLWSQKPEIIKAFAKEKGLRFVPLYDAQALKKAEQTIIDAWNAFGAHLAEDMVDAENLAIIGDGDLAEQIRTLVRQRDAAEASIRAPVEALRKIADGDVDGIVDMVGHEQWQMLAETFSDIAISALSETKPAQTNAAPAR